jgi:hypothetical protein
MQNKQDITVSTVSPVRDGIMRNLQNVPIKCFLFFNLF